MRLPWALLEIREQLLYQIPLVLTSFAIAVLSKLAERVEQRLPSKTGPGFIPPETPQKQGKFYQGDLSSTQVIGWEPKIKRRKRFDCH